MFNQTLPTQAAQVLIHSSTDILLKVELKLTCEARTFPVPFPTTLAYSCWHRVNKTMHQQALIITILHLP
jgi:hypothetical protein